MMVSNTVANIACLVDLLLPDHAFPFAINDLYDALVAAGEYSAVLYEWKKYPHCPKPKHLDDFYRHLLNAVSDILRRHPKRISPHETPKEIISEVDCPSSVPLQSPTVPIPQSPSPSSRTSVDPLSANAVSLRLPPAQLRRWTSHTSDNSPKGELEDCKNDLVLVESNVALTSLHWSQVLVPLGIENSSPAAEEIQANPEDKIFKSSQYIVGNQANRRFVLGIKHLSKSTMELYYRDRSGVLVSNYFDANKDPKTFLRVIVGLTYVEDRYLGLDTSLLVKNNRGYALLNGIKYTVEDFIYSEDDTLGRGTVCLKVTGGDGTSTYALKDAWVDIRRTQREGEILRELNELKIAHIPKVKDHAVLQIDGKDESTQTIRLAISNQIKHMPTNEQPEASVIYANGAISHGVCADYIAKHPPLNLFIPREHYRLLLWPFGRPLTDFRCLEELLLGIRDIVGVIEQLQENGYLHRDVSLNNVILAEDEENSATTKARGSFVKRLEGFLIDYDHAIKIANEDPSTLMTEIDRTGTVPFMAIELLQSDGEPKARSYYHDLESVFYVLCWVCMISAGPGKDRDFKDYKNSWVYKWGIPDKRKESMSEVARLKRRFTMNDENLKYYGEEGSFHKYFEPIFGCLRGLRECLFPPSLCEVILQMLSTEVEKLEGTTDPDEIRKLRAYRNAPPLRERKAQWVFEELYCVIDETISSLPEQHKLASLSRQRSPPSFEPSMQKLLKRKSPEDDQKPDNSSRNKKCRRHKSDPEEYTL